MTMTMKNNRLDNIRMKLLQIGKEDDGGSLIDDGIFETVLMLNALGINTIGSSEGHIWTPEEKKELNLNYGPYVEMCGLHMGKFFYELDELDNLEPDLTEEEVIKYVHKGAQEVSDMQQKLLEWLQEFYSEYTSTEAVRLIISRPDREIDAFTLSSQGAWIRRSDREHHDFLKKSTAEMTCFTKFLTKKYFADYLVLLH